MKESLKVIVKDPTVPHRRNRKSLKIKNLVFWELTLLLHPHPHKQQIHVARATCSPLTLRTLEVGSFGTSQVHLSTNLCTHHM
jgi:hypothetical protein